MTFKRTAEPIDHLGRLRSQVSAAAVLYINSYDDLSNALRDALLHEGLSEDEATTRARSAGEAMRLSAIALTDADQALYVLFTYIEDTVERTKEMRRRRAGLTESGMEIS